MSSIKIDCKGKSPGKIVDIYSIMLYRVPLGLRQNGFLLIEVAYRPLFRFNTRFLTNRSKSSFTAISVLKPASVSDIPAYTN